ncbi:MAG: GDSL-type esterase/lipase family protein [Pseudomonadota bacterium]|nr:GDSL-type esterase/lipase family protein [Pseudomonadota bacterium]
MTSDTNGAPRGDLEGGLKGDQKGDKSIEARGPARGGIRALITAFATAGACVGLAYLHPSLAAYRPWMPGDPLPILSTLVPDRGVRVVEDGVNGLTLAADPTPAPAGEAGASVGADRAAVAPGAVAGGAADGTTPPTADGVLAPPTNVTDGDTPNPARAAAALAAGLPARPPGVPTPLVDPDDRGMAPFYRALHRATQGEGLARAAHYGDSTIAADGITSTVRARLQARFGNGGPGYLSAGMDPRWSMRRDVTIGRKGDWETVSLLLGGGGGRYAYGGIVSTAAAAASLSITAPKGPDGKPTPMHRFELWFQAGADRGAWWAALDGKGVGQGTALAEATGDRHLPVDVPEGYTTASFGTAGGTAGGAGAGEAAEPPAGGVTFYGAVMETKGPGVVWDALGVVGVGSRSFTQHSKKHLASQVAQRRPDLVVVMLGGNELGLPVLGRGDGNAYIPYYQDTVRRLRAGAPQSACLLITPLDQGTREGGTPGTKPNLPRLVEAQRKAAATEGCAFWNGYAAMGGPGAIVRWGAMKPPLAWTDLVHLSTNGQKIIGDLLADAIEHGFDGWLAAGGPNRAPLPPPGPPAEALAEAPAPPAPAEATPAPPAPPSSVATP